MTSYKNVMHADVMNVYRKKNSAVKGFQLKAFIKNRYVFYYNTNAKSQQ